MFSINLQWEEQQQQRRCYKKKRQQKERKSQRKREKICLRCCCHLSPSSLSLSLSSSLSTLPLSPWSKSLSIFASLHLSQIYPIEKKKNPMWRDYNKISVLHQSNGKTCHFCYKKKIRLLNVFYGMRPIQVSCQKRRQQTV